MSDDPRREMNAYEAAIYLVLKKNPGMVHITEDGTKLYLLDPHSEGIICITSTTNFKTMTDDEISKFVADCATGDWTPVEE
jgi:hypothetical protein